MKKPLITSLSNPLIKQARALRQKKTRIESGLFLLEGIHHVGEAPNATVKIILATLLFLFTSGVSTVRYRNPEMFQKTNPLLYMASYGLSFAIALVLAFLGGIILYGF